MKIFSLVVRDFSAAMDFSSLCDNDFQSGYQEVFYEGSLGTQICCSVS